MTHPCVTVLMAVYNGERFLRQAIESILNQTFRDFELVIVDDASTDSTPEIIRSYSDPRIRVTRNECNKGAGYTRNVGLRNAQGDYIAVLDADDVACPHRLAAQKSFLDERPDVALVGTACELIDEANAILGTYCGPTLPLILAWALHFRNPITHSTVMYRRSLALEAGGYDCELSQAEDFVLWAKLSARYSLAQIPESLTQYRINMSGLMRKEAPVLRAYTLEVVARNIQRLTGQTVTQEMAACLNGEKTPGAIVEQCYRVWWECLVAFVSKQAAMRQDRSILFQGLLPDLLRLARQDEACRLHALGIALRYGIRFTPESLLTLRFVKFVAQVVLPARVRQLFPR